jgi:hypothetical protein
MATINTISSATVNPHASVAGLRSRPGGMEHPGGSISGNDRLNQQQQQKKKAKKCK